jgi:hypothetical protein
MYGCMAFQLQALGTAWGIVRFFRNLGVTVQNPVARNLCVAALRLSISEVFASILI